MKVLLANPPWRKDNYFGVRAGTRWPFLTKLSKGQKIPDYVPFPFFLAYTAALLKKENIEVRLIDAIPLGLNESEFLKQIENFSPNLIIQETSTPSIKYDIEIAKKIKENGLSKRIALSGPHVSIYKSDFLKENQFIDYLLIGEYELTALELSKRLKEDKNLEDVKGLIYSKNSEIFENEPRELLADLDTLPYPSRELLPMVHYRDYFCDIPQPTAQIWASRGCPFGCIFCLWPEVIYGSRKYRVRDPKLVAEEMKHIVDHYNPGSIFFDDDTFNIGKERMLKLCSEIIKQDIKKPWAVMARPDTSDEETLRALKDAGMCAIKYGIESGDQEILEESGKSLNLDKAEETIMITKNLDIKTHLTFTIGLLGETEESVKTTLDFALRMNPDSAQFSICTPFPGTKYFNHAVENNFLSFKDFSDFDGAGKAVIRTESLLSEDLERLLSEMQIAWRKHKFKRVLVKFEISAIVRFLKNPLSLLQKISSIFVSR